MCVRCVEALKTFLLAGVGEFRRAIGPPEFFIIMLRILHFHRYGNDGILTIGWGFRSCLGAAAHAVLLPFDY